MDEESGGYEPPQIADSATNNAPDLSLNKSNENDFRYDLSNRYLSTDKGPYYVYMEHKSKHLGKEVVKRWVNIRDAFNKFLKKEKSFKKSGSGTSTLSKYIYAEQLKFLTKIFTHRSTEDSLSANPVQATSDADVSETETENNNNTQLKASPLEL
ncbi:unnamed protein product [Acanthoscelides obtectus]|uniref:MADF domain-containing protein n=1 Tax=Acanthoscelides obtectus TaxID=200917 RepID=A0A9P0LS65_ACAOB|nr:unnamed protein product [Acanthoscelides obtectus]CAK1627070.1 hypothetical protein AOBTE_LOCUS4278 [Acanthoscelides obtectus]